MPTDDDPLADLRQFVEDAETVMYELFAVASDLSGESTRMLVGVSGGVVMSLLGAGEQLEGLDRGCHSNHLCKSCDP